MARMMALENMTEWGASAEIEQETLRSIIAAHGAGKITLPKPKDGSAKQLRYAPSFRTGGPTLGAIPPRPYSVDSLVTFLGWPRYRVEGALKALEAVESKAATDEDFKGLKPGQAKALAEQANRVLKETNKPELARKIAKRLGEGMRHSVGDSTRREGNKSGARIADVTKNTAKFHTDVMLGRQWENRALKGPKARPDLGQFVDQLTKDIQDKIFTYGLGEKVKEVIRFREYLSEERLRMLVGALRSIAQRCNRYADQLEKHALTELTDGEEA
jgi:hypothetical protein